MSISIHFSELGDAIITYHMPIHGKKTVFRCLLNKSQLGEFFEIKIKERVKSATVAILTKYLHHRLNVYRNVKMWVKVQTIETMIRHVTEYKSMPVENIGRYLTNCPHWQDIKPKTQNVWSDIIDQLTTFIKINKLC